MADPRAFISFDFDHDEKQRMLFVGQVKNSRTPFVIQDWSSKVALRQDQWEALINTKINRCHMLIVLVGRTMASARGVVGLAYHLGQPKYTVTQLSTPPGSLFAAATARRCRASHS